MTTDLKTKTPTELTRLVSQMNQQDFHAGYIFNFIHEKHAGDIDDITPLKKDFRSRLKDEGYYISQLKTDCRLRDKDGTIKYLFELADGLKIEAVVIFDEERKTLCVSTQAGCAMDCAFCATGKLGCKRNLTAAEIVDQLYRAEEDIGAVSNVVYMGMGEALNNYESVMDSVRILNSSKGRDLGIRRITISTCGIADAIERLADEQPQPRLAVSLNGPTDALRSRIMPINKKYPLARLFDAVEAYQQRTGNRVTFEYVMIKDFNESRTHADVLVELLKPVRCNVNLIEYNPHPGCDFQPAPAKAIRRFAGVLTDAGIETTIRYKKGAQIKAACGQLGADRLGNQSQRQDKKL